MSIVCLHCKPNKPGRQKMPASRVIESRVIHSRVIANGRVTRTRTMRRRRVCLGCGFRWTTIEYTEAAKRGDSHGQFGRKAERDNLGRLLPKQSTKETNSDRPAL